MADEGSNQFIAGLAAVVLLFGVASFFVFSSEMGEFSSFFGKANADIGEKDSSLAGMAGMANKAKGGLTDLTAAKGITGSGTVGKLPKFVAATKIGDSVMYEKEGNIGIGTINPGANLEVHSDNFGSIGTQVKLTSGHQDEYLTIQAGGYHGLTQILLISDATSRIMLGKPTPAEGMWSMSVDWNLNNNADLQFLQVMPSASPITHLVIQKDTGNVGIGTNEPLGKLDVRGGALIAGGMTIMTDEDLQAKPGITITEAMEIPGGNGPPQVAINAFSYNGQATNLVLQQSPNTGNVGIGVVAPEAKLHVSGGDAIFENDVYVMRQFVAAEDMRVYGDHLELMGTTDLVIVKNQGTGNAYACFDSLGRLYRSSTPCV